MSRGEIKNACNTEMEEVANNYGGARTDGGKKTERDMKEGAHAIAGTKTPPAAFKEVQ